VREGVGQRERGRLFFSPHILLLSLAAYNCLKLLIAVMHVEYQTIPKKLQLETVLKTVVKTRAYR
jgi:hypothetical protein